MHPDLFIVPGTTFGVSSYGFFMGLALVAAWILSLDLARRDRLPTERLGLVFVASAIVGLVSARAIWLLRAMLRPDGPDAGRASPGRARCSPRP